ncbi:DNA cytosine methyltransferase [uncultured Citrobacter sp.]|nr:DNA cytosine methyltransferase [uncultured Citrobacter sp.]
MSLIWLAPLCQDISSAGRGAGIDGDKSGLWKEMARIIDEVRPKYVFVEN